MAILVTGATGTVGREVIDQLSARGIRPKAAVRDKSKAADIGQTAELVTFDFNDEGTYAKALKGVDKVFLLTPVASDMVEMTERFVKAAKAAGVKHIVRLSAYGAQDDATMTIGRWHRDAERVIEGSGIPYTHLRPTLFMQNLIGMAGMIKQTEKLALPIGDAKISMVDARDIAAVAAAVLNDESEHDSVLDITGMQALTGHDVADILSHVTGKQIEYAPASPEEMRASMAQTGMPAWLIDATLELFAAEAAGYYDTVAGTVKEITNRDPILFSQFAEEHKEAWA